MVNTLEDVDTVEIVVGGFSGVLLVVELEVDVFVVVDSEVDVFADGLLEASNVFLLSGEFIFEEEEEEELPVLFPLPFEILCVLASNGCTSDSENASWQSASVTLEVAPTFQKGSSFSQESPLNNLFSFLHKLSSCDRESFLDTE